MSILVPTVGRNVSLESFLAVNLTLKLYSNDRTPAIGDTAASYTEVAGGGYASKTLNSGSWTISGTTPRIAIYNSAQDFTFTGATSAPGTVYGYYIVDSSGILRWVERFPAAVLPFSPILNTLIRITPQLQASSIVV